MKAVEPRITVMIVDDEPAVLHVLTHILLRRGYRVRAALDGESALASALLAPPHLFLVDVRMPLMSGYELCGRLKECETLRAVPVIFLSVLSELHDKVKGFRAGGVDYLTKPFEVEEVEARVKAHLEIRQLQARLADQNLELRETCQRLDQVEKLRDGLHHMIIHDLRTPLTSIYGFLRILDMRARATLPPQLAECIDRSVCSTTELIEMVSSLLDVNKMEAGQLELDVGDCDLTGLAQGVLDRLEILKEGQSMLLEAPPEPVVLRGDSELLRRVFYNLVANALKFVPRRNGRITVSITSLPHAARVTVEDNGPGVPPEYHEKIFEKFGQVELRSHRKLYSTGLGLTFCKLAVEAHGGRIGVVSENGQGSTFWFEIPRTTASTTA